MEENDNNPIEKNVKIILLGENGVGKSSIIVRYFMNEFNENMKSTFGATFVTKKINKGGITYKLNIWDTTGQEKYHSVTKLFLQSAHIAILVYSIDKIDSLKKLDFWNKTIKEYYGEKIILAVVGNKTDLIDSDNDDQVDDDDAEKYAKSIKAIFRLVSAKTDQKGINSLFEEVLDKFIDSCDKIHSDLYEESIKIEKKKIKKKGEKKGCCN